MRPVVSPKLVAPVAVNDSVTVDAGSSVAINTLANDADADGTTDPTSVAVTQSPI